MFAAMMPSTVEFRMRFEELARPAQLALELARQGDVAEREDRGLVLGEDADRRDRHGDAIAGGGDELEIEVVDRLGRRWRARSGARAVARSASGTICDERRPARPSRA